MVTPTDFDQLRRRMQDTTVIPERGAKARLALGFGDKRDDSLAGFCAQIRQKTAGASRGCHMNCERALTSKER